MKLTYTAVDRSGKTVTDVLDAADTKEASERLRSRGLFVTDIEKAKESSKRSHQKRTISVKNVAMWSRQLSVLVRSGTPLAQALNAIERQVNPGPWKDTLVELRTRVEQGLGLAESMTSLPGAFDDVTRSLVQAGESAGQLGPMLDRSSSLLRQQLKVNRTLISAIIYPAVLVFVGAIVTLTMMFLVLPRFEDLFSSLNATLPPTTRFLLALSNGAKHYWWALLGSTIGGVFVMRIFIRSNAGRELRDYWMVRLPAVGRMVRILATARIARVLGVLLDAKVPLLEALTLVQSCSSNQLYVRLIGRAIDAATRGEPVSSVFGASNLIMPSVSEAIRHGEQNGQIGPILTDMADFLDEENEVVVRTTMNLLEPVILVCLGLVVGFIALSLFVPLFDLTSATGGGK